MREKGMLSIGDSDDDRRVVHLRVLVHAAKNLAKRDFFRLPDPFAKVEVDGGTQCHITAAVKGSLDPKWEQHYDVILQKTDSLTISVWNQRKVHRKEGAGFLGSVRLLPSALKRLLNVGFRCLDLTRGNNATPEPVRGQLIVSLSALGEKADSGSEQQVVAFTPGQLSGPTFYGQHDDDLPEGWEVRRTATGRLHYINHVTRVTQWEKPTRSAYETQSHPSSLALTSVSSSAVANANGEATLTTPNASTPHGLTSASTSDLTLSQVGSEVVHDQHSQDEMKGEQARTAASKPGLSEQAPASTTTTSPTRNGLRPGVSTVTSRRPRHVETVHVGKGSQRFQHRNHGNHDSSRHKHYMDRGGLHSDNLLSGYDQRITEQGQIYFVHRVTGLSTWHHPRIPRNASVDESELGPLPDGWEMRKTSVGRVYYVDHKRKTTQFTDPRLAANYSSAAVASTKSTPSPDVHPLAANLPSKRDLVQKMKSLRSDLLPLQPTTGHCRLEVSREGIFEESYRQIMRMRPPNLRRRLMVKFRGEDGLDYGGIAREWIYLLSHEMLNPYYGLFQYSRNDMYTLQINPESGVNPDHLTYFHFVGRVIGMAVFHSHYIDGGFTMPLYKQLLDKPNTLDDLESVDPEYYQSLKWMLENDITEHIETTFSVDYDSFGEKKTIELQPGGKDIAVTEQNKKEYIRLYIQWRFRHGIDPQLRALKKGFNELIPQHLLQIFDERELELVIGGLGKIDIDDWKVNTRLKRCNSRTPLVQWFWQAVKSFDNEKQARLLQFVTGSSRVPLEGFSALQGSTGATEPRLFTIHQIEASTDLLPKAHTCFNRLDMPPYETYEKLLEKLTQAVEETIGFQVE